jgi:alpha-1,6-mannosyltransferase
MFSDDVFAYAAQGKMQVAYDLNPLVDPPAAMGNDPLVNLSPWKDIPTTYGPVWLGVTKGVAAVVQPLGGRPVAYLLAFKLLNVGLLLAGIAMVWAIANRLGWSVERSRAACVLFGWCPLMLFDIVGSAHNDMLLVLFILIAIWLHLRGWWALAVGALMLGGLVKLSGFFLLPAYGVLLWRESNEWKEGVRRVGTAGGVATAVGVLAYSPYAYDGLLKGLASNPLVGAFGPSMGLSVRQGLVDLGMTLRGHGTPSDLTVEGAMAALQWPIWNGALILWAVAALGISLSARDFPTLIRSWALILFTYLVIGSIWFMPWYITWLVPMLALLPAGHLRRAIVLFAWGGTLFYALTPSLPWDTTPNLQNYYVPGVIFWPPLIYLCWIGLSTWLKRTRRAHIAGAEKQSGAI